ncbi:LPXTG cell wall anchor domain-containing protein [Staphylococcus warneri]|uniref:LPXTG cell wall anchor domain-containing protein n=1 Tax=Staphylococcus warneri TaxID=1292 RepID=UPI0016752EA5|nr:LPXTG cell wall anchor domain-containing protein [Staphylococcus warneri]
MKTTKILGATTLAGALLFTGVGATHSNEAHAADKEKVTLETPQDWQKKHDSLLKGRLEHPNQGGEGGGPGTVSSYQKSYQEYVDQNLKYGEQVENTEIIVPDEGKAFLNGQQQTSDNNSNSQSQNNEQGQQQATDNNVATQNNQQQTQSQEPAQAEAKALPETGEQSTNTGLVASIATLLLAVGSALTFKRFSKNNK